ncbi:MAG: Nif3-like dinuclear metal center hexameric protein [Ruminococcus sp.]|nr:Nif3-like dinuclear metal center hexameric protein [Ruminococcus sp.]
MEEVRVGDVYDLIDSIAPFGIQESWDNSGLCVGARDRAVKKITVALDCTADVAREAAEKGSELIVTHHPVIFRAIKKLDLDSVVGTLAGAGLSVICAHTNFDSAVMNRLLCEKLGLTPEGPLAVENGTEMGCVCSCGSIGSRELAERIKNALGNRVVRFNGLNERAKGRENDIRKIAVCSGSGGSFLGEVIAGGCGAFITGDVKHDVFIDAYNEGVVVFDAGHFYTEDIFCEYMCEKLAQSFPGVRVEKASCDRDVVEYLVQGPGL